MCSRSTRSRVSQAVLLAVALLVALLPLAPASDAAAAAAFSMNESLASSESACAVVNTRMYLFGGDVGETNSTASLTFFSVVYSIDFAKTVATGVAADLQSHGVIDPSIARTLNQLAVVQPNGHVLLAGGIRVTTAVESEPNPAVYEFDPSKGATSKLSTTITNLASLSSQQASAATSGESAVYTFGGYDDTGGKLNNRNTLTIVSPDGKATTTNVTSSGPSARQLATMGRLNETHQFLSGGFVAPEEDLGDQWLLETKSLAWTRLSANMARARYWHRTVVYKNQYVIHVGGLMETKPYALVEYTDLSTGRAQVGTIINAANGPASVYDGCAYLLEDVIVYVGGETVSDDKVGGDYAPFLSLLQVQPQSDASLKFKWVTGTDGSPTPSPSAEPSPSGSGGLNSGAIAVIVIVSALVVAGPSRIQWKIGGPSLVLPVLVGATVTVTITVLL
ncbi:hypothetical protein GGF32_005791 [Allomyces javanicus]|nr:hypothetical protein GGF32_005791 [Allomyces javanicus]